jgi:hypothetical protein
MEKSCSPVPYLSVKLKIVKLQLLRLLVKVHLVKSPDSPSGIGESAVPLIAPAVTNAIFAATGKRMQKLPIDLKELLK